MTISNFKKILIANRGEIAIRIARACYELNIRTVGIYAYEDRFSLHRYKTDESYLTGNKGQAIQAYLDMDAIIQIALSTNCQAIHPGYGFLSENSEFAKKCEQAKIKFIGPNSQILSIFSDKVKSQDIASHAGLSIIKSSKELKTIEEAVHFAQKIGYPLVLKSVFGGGGKGIRKIYNEKELKENFAIAKKESLTSFGYDNLYIEKLIENPKHIEVQILADNHNNTVHLFDRDCSIQRRNQKIIEIAPAQKISSTTKEKLYLQALNLANKVSYVGLGTIEFLVDKDENIFFLEVNPRVQVEHTVTEVITGIDLIHCSILVAQGHKLSDESIGIKSQSSISQNGVAIQCRITTEDPLNNFAPDTGKIIAYREATGFGIRLDEGFGTSGGTVTPYYDSLLVKVTSHGKNLKLSARKMYRCLSEFRIRGVKNNIDILKSVITHHHFLDTSFTTNFFDNNPSLFNYKLPRDRATKLLKYIANTTINDPHSLQENKSLLHSLEVSSYSLKKYPHKSKQKESAKDVFDTHGAKGLSSWILEQKNILLTDTTMRDAHQSLFATRLRTKDILNCAQFYSQQMDKLFSLEMWGGATFDTCLRFLKEDPWERLIKIREHIPNILLQMLLRGDNAVGYTQYPSWVIKDFIKETSKSGLDLFRIFDCLNQPNKMKLAIEEVKKNEKIAEACICYTGDLAKNNPRKYNLDYYLKIAKELESMGADILCIKDMAGLLKPNSARILIKELKNQMNIPIHLHTHDTTGCGVTTIITAALSGCDIVDGAVSSMSGLTSQPSLNAIIASLDEHMKSPDFSIKTLNSISQYWEHVRQLYKAFDPGLQSTSTDVYFHEIPGGQYSNLYQQAKSLGLSKQNFNELTMRYREVDELFGRIIKVTPSSKVVGDMALLLQKQNLTAKDFLEKKPVLDYPESIIGFMKGDLGLPEGGIPEKTKSIILQNYNPKENSITKIINKQSIVSELKVLLERQPKESEILSMALYPSVFKEYYQHVQNYWKVSELSTSTFFYGMKQGEEQSIDLEPGKTLYVSLQGVSQTSAKGIKKIFFKLNGFSRVIEIEDEKATKTLDLKQKINPRNENEIGAPMPGKVIEIKVNIGEQVKKGQILIITESMKMEYAITAKQSGIISKISTQQGDIIEKDDLLLTLDK